MAVDNSKLLYLLDPAFQIENIAGKPAVGGHIEVFYAGTDVKVITKQNFDGVDNPFKVPLNNDGRAVMLVSPGAKYDIYFYDSFNNLMFSRLNVFAQGEGEGSVSGLTQIFHDETLTGDGSYHDPLGAIEYTGILPIDVNNDLHLISAQTTRLGVQEPLYFVQDDDEMTVIGLSGGTVPEGTMNESAFGYEDGQITSYNGSAFSAGLNYEAGSYVDIDGNTISVTGLQPSGEYVTSGDLDEYTKRTDFDAAISSLNSAKLDVDVYSSQSALFLTAHQSLEGYATEQWVENKGYLTAVPDNYATTGDLQAVSGDITAMIPSTAGLATENWVTSQGYLTAHQSLDGLMSASLLEQSGGLITGYNGTAFAGQGGGVTGDFELSAGSGISIVDYPLEQKTVISVTAQGGNPEVEQAVIDNSATWNTVSNKLDTTAFSDVSGTFLTAHQDLSDYQTIAGMTAYQEAGNYLSANALDNLSGNWENVTAKLDTTAFSDVSSTFLTGVDLTPYQTIEGMTAYQPVGSYLTADALDSVSGDWNEVSAKLDTTAFSDVSGTFLTAHQDISNKLDTTAFSDVSGSFLTGIPDTYLQNTDLSTADGKVTAISGIPLSAGGDVPEGVMVESGLEYNAVNEISAYNGSAIAQYGAEKQWLQHDDTIVHVSNSAQYAFGCNISALQRLMGIDETVLYLGTSNQVTASTTATLNENWNNFNKIRVTYKHSYGPGNTARGGQNIGDITVSAVSTGFTIGVPGIYCDDGTVFFDRNSFGFNTANLNKMAINAAGSRLGFTNSASWSVMNARGVSDIAVYGIGRKEV